MKHIMAWIITGTAICLAGGCASMDSAPEDQNSISADQMKTFCVMPFVTGKYDVDTDEAVQLTFTCPLSQLCFGNNKLAPDADAVMSRIVQKNLENYVSGNVIPLAEVAKAYGGIAKDTNSDSLRSLALKLGGDLKVDYVVAGTVWRFQERVGNAMSVEKPASVAFALYLFDVNSGEIIWMTRIDETQATLSDNLLNAADFFKQGAQWLSAEELADFGIEDALKNFPVQSAAENKSN